MRDRNKKSRLVELDEAGLVVFYLASVSTEANQRIRHAYDDGRQPFQGRLKPSSELMVQELQR